MPRSIPGYFAAAMAGSLFLSGCAQASNASSAAMASEQAQTPISVVTTTNVYGEIAKAIGGGKVQVTSIISKTSQDPHSYEPTPQDKLALSKAGLAIGNGGGYDPFFDTITKESGLSPDRIIHGFDVAELDGGGESPAHGDANAAESDGHAHGEVNEHAWYNMAAASKIAQEIAARLSVIDPAGASGFAANAEKFKAETTAISDKLASIKSMHNGETVALTEPLPVYMLEEAGLENRTPEDFLEAAEEGNDVPAGALKETIDVVSSKSVVFLAYNDQTSTPQTETVRKAAETATVPVVEFTETLPEGKSFIQWMNDNADNIAAALRH